MPDPPDADAYDARNWGVHFIGIDLAWGERSPSGIAVLAEDGTLVRLSSATSDDSVAVALAPYLDEDCIVGIDAPLIVTNATGNRPCEAALNRDFARFEAGAHPSNTGRPELRGTPRGARLAARFGLDIDPGSTAARRAIEVYPHPALVALFRLPRTLKYKQRQRRPFDGMHAEMLRLIGLLEGLAEANPPLRLAGTPWHEVAQAVSSARRKSELRQAEDQLDAVVCAYVAMLVARYPASTTTYGDAATGYIITPTLPAGLEPAGRSAGPADAAEGMVDEDLDDVDVEAGSSSTGPSQRAIARYAELQPIAGRAAQRLADWLTGTLDDAGINYLDVTGRGKGTASFAGKARRTVDGRPVYPDPLADITDQVGARVITYVRSDVAAVADLIADQLTVLDDRDMGQLTAQEGRFGYVSRHLQIPLDPVWLGDLSVAELRVPSAQVQIRTVLQHAWAEFEHDIRYKGSIPEDLAPDLNRRFTLAAGLLELADAEFEVIRNRLRQRPARHEEGDAGELRISPEELAAFLAGSFPEAGWSRTEHYRWIAGLLPELGIDSLHELSGLLATVDTTTLISRMGYRYPPGAVRRLDDALLAIFGTAYIGLQGNAHRVALLRARLEKIQQE